ncbi:von Willebrand factor A domain-containing protein 5A-like isoform X2 [Oreochromis aureus]|nr:von Willebrand factor A domain-containing protein 5A-like isoform X2 [Oreochromis aureus]
MTVLRAKAEKKSSTHITTSTRMNFSGLLTLQKERVPLKSIEVELEVRDHVATVVSTLNYENKKDKPLEAVFVFPLPGDAAVCHFSAKIGQTQIVAEVKEKQKAHEEYDDALNSGQQAFLLEESDQSPDIFSLSVGSLPPRESASIRLEYVTELSVQADDGLRFCLPAVLNPRFNPQYKYRGRKSKSLEVVYVPASWVPYTLSFSARVSSPRPISKVESNCSLDPLQYLNTDQTQATVKLAAGHKFDRDVELLIYYKDAHQPTAVVEAGQASAEPGTLMGDPVVMVSLYPEFPETVMSSGTSCGEFVFLMDRSGSMDCAISKSEQEEARMSSARDAVLLLLKNLPMGCYFNIYSFGSSYEHIFPKSVEYSQETMEEALKNVDQMEADLGGSGMLEPLKHIYNQPCIPSHPRQLFVFTDGEVWDTKEVIDLVKKNSDSHRCFSFGIGEGASSALINGMAKEGGGHAQFITGTDRMQAKVMQSLRFALHHIVTVIWDLPKEVSVTVLSPPITILLKGQRLLIYAQLTGQSSEAAEGCVTLKYSLAGHPCENQLHFSLRPAEDTGLTVHRLGARSLIRSLEVEDREHKEHEDGGVKEKLVQLSVQSGVSSSFTAFIPVNKDNGDTIQGRFLLRNIPKPFEMERDRPWRVSRPARSWSTRMNCSGLLNLQKEPVPLKSIEVQLEVRDHVATVVSTLNYENKEDKPLEAVFVFPLPGDAAVCHFSAKIGQTQIVAEVKEKQEARKEYDDALSSGQQAFLLEESDQSPDIFSLSVGSLLPGESASIRLEYVTELAVQADDGLRFCLPAVLNPRYQPQDFEGAGVQVTSVPASLLFYSLSFSARVSSPRPISTVESNCSLDPLQYLNTDQTQATVNLAAGHKFDRDVELLIYYKDAHQPTAVVEAGQASAEPGCLMGDSMVMVSLYPEFPQSVMSSMASCGEFVFLMDRSGSMSNTRIRSAKDTLLLLLKSLPMGCYFNIYGFGSRYEHIFPKSVEYTQQTMEEALKSVEQMQADLGGTEILEPLKHIYSQPCIPSQPRQLFVFTDGEVGNTKEVIDLVKKNSDSHRCFSFGIGEGASSALINGMAKEGGGHAQFITGTDRMQAKVMQSLRFALQPTVVDISGTWDLPKEVSVTVLSPPIKTLFQGQRSLIYAQLTGQSSEAAEGCVTVKYSLAGHPSENQLHFSLRPAEDTGLTVHRLGARTLIRSLEMEERESRGQQDGEVKKKLVRLSVQSGVSSSFTAFIAVNKDNSRVIQGPLVRRNIPTPMTPRYGSALRATPIRGSCSSLPIPDTYSKKRRNLCRGVPPRFGSALPAPPIRRSCSPPAMCSIPDTNLKKMRNLCRGVGSPMAMCSISDTTDSFCGGFLDDFALPKQPPRDPFMHLVSLQKASGSWLLDPGLATALGKTSQQVEKIKPRTANSEVWATILALVWLHAFKMDAKDEWEFLALKAASWLRAQNAPCVSECVESGNVLLGCSIKKEALGL